MSYFNLWLSEIRGKRKLSDIEYLSIKEFDSKLFTEISATFTTTGVKITRTIASGKSFYIAKASIIPIVNTVASTSGLSVVNRRCTVDVKYDGTVIDTLGYDFEYDGANSNRAAMGNAFNLESQIIGKKLDGDAVKKVELDATSVSGTYKVRLIGFEETTADTPAV